LDLRFIEGTEIRLTLKDEMTVAKAKEIAREATNIEGEISLIFKGRILDDKEVLNKIPGIDKTFIIVHNKKPKRKFDKDFLKIGLRSFLPRLTSLFELVENSNDDPPHFNTLVNNLMEMGFEKGECERALRLSGYIPDSAATLLLSGSMQHFKRPQMTGEENPETNAVSSADEEVDLFCSTLEYDDEEEDDIIYSDNDVLIDDLLHAMINGDDDEDMYSVDSGDDENNSELIENEAVGVNIPHLNIQHTDITVPPSDL
jgi:hypothetical protein